MNSSEQLRQILSRHLPLSSLEYCIGIWEKNPFHFTVNKARKTKLGDFRYRRDRSIQTITINGNLNPYQFLLTYIHEVAHLQAFLTYGMKIPPHGSEWKKTFQLLIAPLLRPEIFPKNILVPLGLHMRNPKASSARDLFLMKEMSKYDSSTEDCLEVFLSDLKPGIQFELSGRIFKKGETRRTRVLCEEVKTGRKYLIAQLARIKPID